MQQLESIKSCLDAAIRIKSIHCIGPIPALMTRRIGRFRALGPETRPSARRPESAGTSQRTEVTGLGPQDDARLPGHRPDPEAHRDTGGTQSQGQEQDMQGAGRGLQDWQDSAGRQ